MIDCPFVPLKAQTQEAFDLNSAHVGQPYLMPPFGSERKPTIIGAGASASNETSLTFRAPDYHFYAFDVRLYLYSLNGAETEITKIDPNSVGGGTPSPVYISLFSPADRHRLSTREVHWATFQGDAREPYQLPRPIYIGPGQQLDVRFRNGSVSNKYAVAMTLGGVRLMAGERGNKIRKGLPRDRFVAAARAYGRPMGPDPSENVLYGGVPRFLSTPSTPVTYSSGTFGTPGVGGDQTIPTDNAVTTFIQSLNGTTVVGSSDTRQPVPTANIFVRLTTRRWNQVLTGGFVPYGHVFGDGRHPGWLTTPMVLPENDAMVVEALNMEGEDVDCNYGFWAIDRR